MKLHGTKTDWDRVKRGIATGAPIPHDPEADLYDPNDEAATRAFWVTARIARVNAPLRKAVSNSKL